MIIKQIYVVTGDEGNHYVYGLSDDSASTLYLWAQGGWELVGNTFSEGTRK